MGRRREQQSEISRISNEEREEKYLADAWAYILSFAEESDDGPGQEVTGEDEGA